MANVKHKTSQRSKEITENYLQFLDQHIESVMAGDNDFMEINEIAKELFVSHQHLADTIQKETGHHPCYFYDLKIIEKAKVQLLNTDQSVAKIALNLTYDPSNFSKFFKKFTGQTPNDFRKQHRLQIPKSSP